MSGLNHDFLIVDKSEYEDKSIYDFYHLNTSIHLHDDFLTYIYDSLIWIPSINIRTNKKNNEFNRWGDNLFNIEGCKKITKIFSSWATIFNEGPEILDLKGAWNFYDEPTEDDLGEYERLIIPKVDLVQNLNTIAYWASEVVESRGKKILLHLGI